MGFETLNLVERTSRKIDVLKRCHNIVKEKDRLSMTSQGVVVT